MKPLLVFLLAAATLLGQQLSQEDTDLRAAISEAGSSQVDTIRALELHLRKYPDSPQKSDIESAIVKLAMEVNDNGRILQYGDHALAVNPGHAELMERMARLLVSDDKNRASLQRGLQIAQQLERWVRVQQQNKDGDHNLARRSEELNLILAGALTYQAHAVGILVTPSEGLPIARASLDASATPEAAREIASLLERLARPREAIAAYADAFILSTGIAEADSRAAYRKKMWELAPKAGLLPSAIGQEILKADDRLALRIATRRAALRELEPNLGATQPHDYVISGLGGEKLALRSLKGKVVVIDFWATWCLPCRAQQPLYEEVKSRFQGNSRVVFLNVATDDDHSVVKPFIDQNKWNKTVYYDDGLAVFLKVASIPTTTILNGRGDVAARMNGFIPEKFVDMLTERINEALQQN